MAEAISRVSSKKFCDEHGMRFSTSDVAHPWQNGLAERSNQAIKSIAKKVLMSEMFLQSFGSTR